MGHQSSYRGKSSRVLWLLLMLFIILGAVSAYLLGKLYYTTHQLADANLKSFVQRADFRASLLQELFARRIGELKAIANARSLKALLEASEDGMSSQITQPKSMTMVESDFSDALRSVGEPGLQRFLSIAYYDFESARVLVETPKSSGNERHQLDVLRKIKSKVSREPEFFDKCEGNNCSIYLAWPVFIQDECKGIILGKLNQEAIQDKLKSRGGLRSDESMWIVNRDEKIVLGPELITGSSVSQVFGMSINDLRRVKTVNPIQNGPGHIVGPQLVVARNSGVGGFSILEVAPDILYANAPSFRIWGLLVVSLIGGLGLMMAYVYRSFHLQNSMNLELNEAKSLLETRVHERTLELETTNKMLAQEAKERQQSQEKLYQQAQILGSITDTILIISTEKRIIYANAPACQLFGDGSEESLVGKRCYEILKDFKEVCDECTVDMAISKERPHKRVTIWHDKTGKELWVYNTAFPYHDDHGQLLGAILLSTDYSAQKEIEIALNRAKEQAEAASKAKSDFLARMSHEIRTPMYGILGTLELVLDGELKSEQRDLLLTAKFSAEALQGILDDILDFSKIEARKVDLEETTFSPLTMVETVFDTLAIKAHEKGLELVSDVKPDIPSAVIGDPLRLRQILLNLVGNAIKFTDRGEIVITVFGKQRLRDQIWLEFVVSDTGIGVSPDKLKTIFDPFAQAEGFISRTFGGTGLGLAISSALVNIMGGEIWAESEPGRGSSFHFSIPLKIIDDLQPLNEQYCLGPADVRVLVVDDNPTNRRILIETMARWGFCSDEAPDAQKALVKLAGAESEQRPYHLILLDQRLPGMSGLELLRQLGAKINSRTILLSSSADIRDREESEKLGVAGFLLKPVKQSDLKKSVLMALGQGVRPVEDETRAKPQELANNESNISLNILLAEDNPVNQKLIKKVLENRGHTVSVVTNGKLAVQAVKESVFDLVLMDIQMPEMDGLTATSRIRSEEEGSGKHIPIFAMTAHAYKEAEQMCRQSGMDGYLTKPISGAKLTMILDRVFAGKTFRSTKMSE